MTAFSMHFGQDAETALPVPIDSETAALLRGFLLEIFEKARSWEELRARLEDRGYELGFRSGHLVVVDDRGTALCTGSMLGLPLSQLAQRLGRPRIRSAINGGAGQLS